MPLFPFTSNHQVNIISCYSTALKIHIAYRIYFFFLFKSIDTTVNIPPLITYQSEQRKKNANQMRAYNICWYIDDNRIGYIEALPYVYNSSFFSFSFFSLSHNLKAENPHRDFMCKHVLAAVGDDDYGNWYIVKKNQNLKGGSHKWCLPNNGDVQTKSKNDSPIKPKTTQYAHIEEISFNRKVVFQFFFLKVQSDLCIFFYANTIFEKSRKMVKH